MTEKNIDEMLKEVNEDVRYGIQVIWDSRMVEVGNFLFGTVFMGFGVQPEDFSVVELPLKGVSGQDTCCITYRFPKGTTYKVLRDSMDAIAGKGEVEPEKTAMVNEMSRIVTLHKQEDGSVLALPVVIE